jgi:cytochrome c-type biogenesis protein CcmH
MIEFIFFSIALLVIVTWLIAPALLGKSSSASENTRLTNIAIARERLAELDSQLKQGEIDQAHYNQARDEIDLALLDDARADEAAVAALPVNYRRNIFILLTAIPFLAFGLYQYWGAPQAITRTTAISKAQESNPHSKNPHENAQAKAQHSGSLTEMIAKLEAKLGQDPNNPDGWYMLAKSYMYLKQYAKAETAFRKLHSQVGDQADVLLGLSDSMAMAKNGDMQGEPFELAKRALELAPNNTTALWLTGMGYRDSGDYASAISLWNKLLPLLDDNPQSKQEVNALIENAKQQLGTNVTTGPTIGLAAPNKVQETAPIPAKQAAQPNAQIKVTVQLDPALKNSVSNNDYVMVYAQRVQGMKMPLAMYKGQVKDLPMTVTLSDALALSPMNKLSDQQDVNVIARLSKSGQAMKAAGDIEAVSGPHPVKGSDPVIITLHQ